MTDIERKEIEKIKKELNLHGEYKDLEMLRIMKRISDGMDEAERIMNLANTKKKKCRILNIFKKRG